VFEVDGVAILVEEFFFLPRRLGRIGLGHFVASLGTAGL
jgi:hypothetical protein